MRLQKWHGFFLLLLILGFLQGNSGAYVGINIGTEVSDLPSASDIVTILKVNQITHVKLYDADARMLKALSNSGIDVIVGVTNEEVLGIGESPSIAGAWINKNVAAYLPSTNITYIAVGSEVLTSVPGVGQVLVPAMNYLHKALVAANLNLQVKVSAPQSMSLIPKSFPPSTAAFNSSWNSIIYQLLQFYSIEAMNFSGIPVMVTETGWPSSGGSNEPDATVGNALAFNKNLIRRVLNGTGPPSQPDQTINTYIYELFNEDKRSGPVSEKNWGLLFTNGTAVYPLSLSTSDRVTANSTDGFCVAKSDADADKLQEGLNWVCGPGLANCSAIQQGQPCYEPNTVVNHATYAYNDYYQRMHSSGGTCDFQDTATLTTVDPSSGSCIFTGSSNTSSSGLTPPSALAPSSPQSGSFSGVSVSRLQLQLWVICLALVLP